MPDARRGIDRFLNAAEYVLIGGAMIALMGGLLMQIAGWAWRGITLL